MQTLDSSEDADLELMFAEIRRYPLLTADEEKVIEKLVIGDKLFKPTQSQQTLARPSRSVETSFEGIFWAFALLAFAVAIMFLINNAS